jgi:chromosome partitioning protein
MAKTISIAQVKGGAGRSTLATNLAGELAKLGHTVLIDADMPQGTSASWYAMRQQAGKTGDLASGLIADTATDYRELIAKVEQHQDADYIVLDGPPRIAEMTRAMVLLADLVLVPVGASMADLWATGDVLAMVAEANAVKDVQARLVWTRHRAATRLAKDLTVQAKAELAIEPLKAVMALRTAYVVALGAGLTAAETLNAQARTEVQALVAEVRAIIS